MTPKGTYPPDLDIFVVVDRNFLVSADLEEALLGLGPRSRVMTYAMVEPARGAVESISALSAAFVGLPFREMRSDPLIEMVQERGGRVIFVGGESSAPPEEAEGFYFLRRPITPEAVRRVLRA